jgi:nucleotide-binding universal stress UspA family protein
MNAESAVERDVERREPEPVSPLRLVLLATDLGPASVGAEQAAIELARQHGAVLLIVTVIDPSRLRLPGGRYLMRIDQARAAREAMARELVARCRAGGVLCQSLVWDGDPTESILEVAASEHADAIVVGSHGRGPIGRLLLGSVSERIVAQATCPVFVVREEHVVRREPATRSDRVAVMPTRGGEGRG